MNAQQFLDSVYTTYRGKIQTKTPLFGSDKANVVLSIANRKKNEWANDTTQAWRSLFRMTAPYETGTVATAGTTTLTGTGTYFTDYQVGDRITVSGETERTIDSITSDTVLTVSVAFSNTASGLNFIRSIIIKSGITSYNLPRSFITPSDKVLVTTSTQTYEFSIYSPQKRASDCYIYGNNPKVLTFSDPISVTGQLVGGVLTVPACFLPNDLVNATDLIPVDNPEWLVYIVASELARNDPAKDDQFPTLVAMANDLYSKMSIANFNLGFLNGGTVYNNMPQISEDLDTDWTV